MTVFVDMDGVLADFDRCVQARLGDKFDLKTELEKDNWGAVGKIQDLYAHLEPIPDAHDLMDWLRDRYQSKNVQILTAIPRRAHFPDAVNHKRDWIHKWFGVETIVRFGPYAYDKQFHCMRDVDILIDDMARNVNQWKERGGIGILHTSAENSIKLICEDFINRLDLHDDVVKTFGELK